MSGNLLTPTHALTLPFPCSFQCLSTHQLLGALPAASGMSQTGSYSAGPSAGNTVCSSPAQSTEPSRPQHRQALKPEEPVLLGAHPALPLGCRCGSQLPDERLGVNIWCTLDGADSRQPPANGAGVIAPSTSSALSCLGQLHSGASPGAGPRCWAEGQTGPKNGGTSSGCGRREGWEGQSCPRWVARAWRKGVRGTGTLQGGFPGRAGSLVGSGEISGPTCCAG